MAPHRRTATRVKAGQVQKKNNWEASERSIFARPQDEIRLERRDPGAGYRHLFSLAQLRTFLTLLPEWDELAVGLDAIVLDDGNQGCMGWCGDGVVAVCAWERDLWWEDALPEFIEEHAPILDLLDVRAEEEDGRLVVRWTEDRARAFQLLHILTHELGHHHDRMTTRSRRQASRGEPYAEAYAIRAMEELWPAYVRAFGL
ncbi:hypothetical protein AB0L40_05465 [Patulibacter sp. NPDC049589]|uniref:hypothetical protein n=1 Tax=Patulibacter sp. NPDC049589 TaxID=3154731 RepID=UPI003447F3AE